MAANPQPNLQGALSLVAAGQALFDKALARAKASGAVRLYTLGCVAICLMHLTLIDREAFMLNSEYLSLADPSRNGVGGGLGAFVNNILRPISLPAFLLLAIRDAPARGPRPSRRGTELQSLLLALVCAYVFAFSLALFSRYLMIYVFVFFMGRMFSRRGARGGLGGAPAFAFYTGLILLCFAVAQAGRSNAAQGLSAVGAVLDGLRVEQLGWILARLGATSFDGAISFANALRHDPIYEPSYQLLSFSPLPSFIDGFDAREMEQRINIYVPFSAFGETAHFHPVAVPILFAVCALVTRQLTLGYFRDRDALTVALYPVFLVCLATLQTYPLRASFRSLVAIGLISWLSVQLRRRRERRQEAALPPGLRSAVSG